MHVCVCVCVCPLLFLFLCPSCGSICGLPRPQHPNVEWCGSRFAHKNANLSHLMGSTVVETSIRMENPLKSLTGCQLFWSDSETGGFVQVYVSSSCDCSSLWPFGVFSTVSLLSLFLHICVLLFVPCICGDCLCVYLRVNAWGSAVCGRVRT